MLTDTLTHVWEERERLSIAELREALEGTASAQGLFDTSGILWHLVFGQVLTRTTRFREAEHAFTQAQQKARDLAEPYLEVYALLGLANVEGFFNHFDRAERTLDLALQLAQACDFLIGKGLALVALSRIHWHQAKNKLAIVRLEESRQILSSCAEPRLVALSMLGLMNQLASSGDTAPIPSIQEKVLSIVREYEWNSLLPTVLFSIAMRQISEVGYADAVAAFTEVMHAGAAYDEWYIPKALWGLSWAAIHNKDWKKGIEYLTECRQKVLSTPHFVADCDVALAMCYYELEQHSEALSILTSISCEKEYLTDKYYELRAKAQRKLGAMEACLSDYESALSLARAQYGPQERHKLVAIQIELATEQIQSERAISALHTQLVEQQLTNLALNLVAQTEAVSRLADELRSIVSNGMDPALAIRKIKEKLKELPMEQIDWLKFEEQFRSAHPDFRQKLLHQYPNLTGQEVRVCQLLRVGMKSHEVARLICISERAVENYRFNIRKKLGLTTEQSLTRFLEAIR